MSEEDPFGDMIPERFGRSTLPGRRGSEVQSAFDGRADGSGPRRRIWNGCGPCFPPTSTRRW